MTVLRVGEKKQGKKSSESGEVVRERTLCLRSAAGTHAGFRIATMLVLVGALSFFGGVTAGHAQSQEPGSVWGNVDHFTDTYIRLQQDKKKEKKKETKKLVYSFVKEVTMDTYSLQSDGRGNVRLIVDDQGKALKVYFYGIDMPEVFKQFKR